MIYNVIIYCLFKKTPNDGNGNPVHWKPEIPDFEDQASVRDFVVLGEKAGRKMCHMLVEYEDSSVRDYIDTFNQGKPITLQILNWWHRDVEKMYQAMWSDIGLHPLIEDIAKAVMRYPVQDEVDGETINRIVSVESAENDYSEVIDPQKIMIPHRFSGR